VLAFFAANEQAAKLFLFSSHSHSFNMQLTLLAIAAIASQAAAHGGVIGYAIDGTWVNGYTKFNLAAHVATLTTRPSFKAYNDPASQKTVQRPWADFNPITDVSSSKMTCNSPGTASPLSTKVAAGSKLTAFWNQWPHAIGPVVVWMTECPGDCASMSPATASQASWFKIDEAGLLSGTVGKGEWGGAKMVADNSSWTSTIPPSLKAGNYLLRHEMIALHSPPAQFYPECAQVQVTGAGTAQPPASARATIPGVYKMSDPAVSIVVYSNEAQKMSTYTIPGPKVWTGA